MLKIITKKIDGKYIVELLENNKVKDMKVVKSSNPIDRDMAIKDWIDIYQVMDINHVTVNSDDIKPQLEDKIPSIPYTDIFLLENYFDENHEFVFDRIIEATKYGLSNNKKKIRLFEFDNLGIYITSNKSNWINGVKVAMNYYMEHEKYRKCSECEELLKILS